MRIDAEEATRSSKYNKQLNAKHGTNNTCFLVYDTFCVVFTNCKTYGEKTKKIYQALCFVCKNVDPPKETNIDWL